MSLSRFTLLATLLVAPAAAAQTTADSNPFGLNVVSQDSALKANAGLDTQVQALTTGLHIGVEADPSVINDPLSNSVAASASRETLGFSAGLVAEQRAHLDLSVGDSLSQSWTPLSLITTANHQVISDNQSASLGLTLTPLNSIDLSLTGSTARDDVRDSIVAETATPVPSLFSTATQSAAAGVKWRPLGWFSLDARGQVDQASAEWRGAAVGGADPVADTRLDYSDFAPSITGALTLPWQDNLSLTFEHAVTPLDPHTFSSFAAVEDREPDARLGPGREWRYRVNFDQTLAGALKLNAVVTEAQIEAATELGPVGEGLQAPVSVPGGQRQEVQLALSTPLAALGLPSITLKGQGAWRDSQVRDPFTGELRRASSESPMDASLSLVQSLPQHRARWGLEGHFGGDQTIYQMSQITQVRVADSLGGFVEYAPGPFALRLQVDGLYGGDRNATDVLFAAPRSAVSLDPIDRVDSHTDSGQAVRLILRKSL